MPGEQIRYPFTKDGLRDALLALGTDFTAVARNLVAMGFKGHRGECHTCPVAKYLLAVMEEIDKVDVSMGRVRIGRTVVEYTDVRPDELTVPTSNAVEDFVEYFDMGAVSALDVEAPDAA